MLVGIADVARHAGVSTATVSAVVNGTRYVSPERTEAVRRAIAELRYTPNGLARSLAQQRSGLIGLVIPSLTNPIYPEIVHPIQRILDGAGYSLVLCESQESEGQERAASELLRVRRVDGLIVAPSSVKNLDVLHEFHRAGVPVVLLNRRLGGPPFDRVVVEYASATHAAVDHLVRLGRRRIALLALPNYEASADGERDGRLIGYRSAVEKYKLADLSVVCEGPRSPQAAERAVQHLLRRRQPPDALIASSPSITLGALAALRARRCSIPSDVALVGYGDLAWMRLVDPPLTVVDGAFEAVGQRAAELLLERLGGGGPEGSTEVSVQAHLVIRGSTIGLHPSRTRAPISNHAVSRTIDPPGSPAPARALRLRRSPGRREFNLKGGSRPAT